MVTLQKWSLYWRENDLVTESELMEGEWSYYGGGQFSGGRMIMLQRWIV